MVIFTKFDAQIALESAKLDHVDDADKWEIATKHAEITFQTIYLPKVLQDTNYPPKAYVCLASGDHLILQ